MHGLALCGCWSDLGPVDGILIPNLYENFLLFAHLLFPECLLLFANDQPS
jgi:hypothetical protein